MKLLTSESYDDAIIQTFLDFGRKGHTIHDVLEVTIVAPKRFRYNCLGDQERVRVDLRRYAVRHLSKTQFDWILPVNGHMQT